MVFEKNQKKKKPTKKQKGTQKEKKSARRSGERSSMVFSSMSSFPAASSTNHSHTCLETKWGNSWIWSQSFHLLTSAGQTAAVQGVKMYGRRNWLETDREKQQKEMRLQRKTKLWPNADCCFFIGAVCNQFVVSLPCRRIFYSSLRTFWLTVAPPSSFIIAIGFFLLLLFFETQLIRISRKVSS